MNPTSNPIPASATTPKRVCKGCNLAIGHCSIVQFGNGIWHLNCFRCVKCSRSIEPDDNLLLLADGSPLCSNCSQHCCVCKLPIYDEAVMTADQCYHGDCFRCSKCNSKIDGSLFARTSNGIFCMSCYAERKEQQKKKGILNGVKNQAKNSKEKSLPSIPVEALFNIASPEPYSPTITYPETTPGLPKNGGKRSSFTKEKVDNNNNSNNLNNRSLDSPFLPPDTNNPETNLTRRPTNASLNSSSSIEQSYSSFYVEGLLSDIKNLQTQLADSEFNYSKLKLHSDQVNERIKVFQEEFTIEINRRKTAEANLQKIQMEHENANSTVAQLSLKISTLESKCTKLEKEIIRLEKKKQSLTNEMNIVSNPKLNRFNTLHKSNSSSSLRDLNMNNLGLSHSDSLENLSIKKDISSEPIEIRPVNIEDKRKLNNNTNNINHLTINNNEDNFKSRVTSVRRSLDVRSIDKMKGISKRASMDELSILEIQSPSSSPTNNLLSTSPSLLESTLPNSRLDKNKDKKFNWRNAFRINQSKQEALNNSESIKASISIPISVSDSSKGSPVSTPGQIDLREILNDHNVFENKSTGHQFVNHNYLRPIKCDHCKEKMWGIQAKELRCSICGYHSHSKCVKNISTVCSGPNKGIESENELASKSNSSINEKENNKQNSEPCTIFGVELETQVEIESPRSIPLIVEQCVTSVEARGMELEGIYRKSGPQSNMKALRKQLTQKEDGQPPIANLEEFQDITIITSVLKQYFRELPQPLFTYKYHNSWIEVHERIEEEKADAYANVLNSLPNVYKDTLIYFMDHLYKVYCKREINLMSSKNLGVVFGPTLMRNLDERMDFDQMALKNGTIDNLIQLWPDVKLSLE